MQHPLTRRHTSARLYHLAGSARAVGAAAGNGVEIAPTGCGGITSESARGRLRHVARRYRTRGRLKRLEAVRWTVVTAIKQMASPLPAAGTSCHASVACTWAEETEEVFSSMADDRGNLHGAI